MLGIALLFLCIHSQLRAQPLTLRVVEADSQEPIPYATISLSGKKYLTDATGVKVFKEKNVYPLEVEVGATGYKKKKQRISKLGRYKVALEPVGHELSAVYVEAKKNRGVSTATTVELPKAVLGRSQMLSLGSLLSKLSGVRSLSTGAMIEKPIIEGLSGSRVAIISDGVKLSGQHWGGDHAPELSLPSYASVSVVKGAEGVRYGAGVLGGAVVVDTSLDPTDRATRLSLNTSYTDNGRVYGGDGFLELGTALWGGGLRARLAGKYYRSGDYKTAEYLLYNTGSKISDYRLDLGYQKGRYKLDLSATSYLATLGIYSGSHIGNLADLLGRFEMGRPSSHLLAPFSYKIATPRQEVAHHTLQAKLGYQLSPIDQFELQLSLQQDHRREYDYRKGDNVGKPSFAFKLKTTEAKARYEHLYTERLQGELGLDLLYHDNVSDRGTNTVPLIPNYIRYGLGVFNLWQYRPREELLFTLGLRGDWTYMNAKGYDRLGEAYGSEANYAAISASLSVQWQPIDVLSLKSHLALAQRAPEMNELYSRGVHHGEALYLQGDSLLRTEKAIKWTNSLDFHQEDWHLEGTAFVQMIFDYIYDRPLYYQINGKREIETVMQLSGIFPVYYYKQTNGLFGGGDLTATYAINAALSLFVRGEWLYARDVRYGNYFPEIPSDRYTLGVKYHHHYGQRWFLSSSLRGVWVTKQQRFDPDMDLLPASPEGYTLLEASLALSYRLPRAGLLQFYFEGGNLLNTLYKDYTNRLRFFAHDRGRSLTVGLRYSL